MTGPLDRYERLTAFSLDHAVDEIESKYDPYLELHGIDPSSVLLISRR